MGIQGFKGFRGFRRFRGSGIQKVPGIQGIQEFREFRNSRTPFPCSPALHIPIPHPPRSSILGLSLENPRAHPQIPANPYKSLSRLFNPTPKHIPEGEGEKENRIPLWNIGRGKRRTEFPSGILGEGKRSSRNPLE